MRSPEELAADIQEYSLLTFKDETALAAHIRATWTCGEIDTFSDFTEAGTFTPDGGYGARKVAGIVFTTAAEAARLKRIFRSLHNEVYIFMGAAAVLGEMNAKMCCGIFTDDGAILGLTINELRQLFNGKQTVLARLDKLENGLQKMPTARTVAAASREGARLALDEDPCTHRKKGGGRKPKYQNGKNQVLEVLKEVCTAKTKKASALAYSETVFNRWARSKKPHGYTSAKSLDSRVRDYLKANELPDLLDDTAKEKIKAHLDRLQKPHAVTK